MIDYFCKPIAKRFFCLFLFVVAEMPLSTCAIDTSWLSLESKKITVIGTGYVGLVLGAGLAEWGHKVVCVDILEEKIRLLQEGKMPFYEPGLDVWVNTNVAAGRLRFSTDIVNGIQASDVIFITLPTPTKPDGTADISVLEEVSKTIAKNINSHKIVCIKSTVPIGTTRKIQILVNEQMSQTGHFSCEVIFNPEFLREGSALVDFTKTDRFVVGGENPLAIRTIKEVFSQALIQNVPCIDTDFESAEAIKYASNAFLATKISFINEFANLCDVTGADISTVAYGMGLDPRIGPAFLNPGPGYGGSCFPKDTSCLLNQGVEHQVDLKIVQATIEANDAQISCVVKKLKQLMSCELANKKITILGLAFKPNTDDIRCSPAITIIEQLLAEGAIVSAYDPMAMHNMQKILPNVKYQNTLLSASEEAEAVIILTDWEEIINLDLISLRNIMKTPVLVDTRNLYDPQKLEQLGFIFCNIGRPLKKRMPPKAF